MFWREQDDDPEYHCRRADDRGANQHRLGRGFEGVAAAVRLFEEVFRVFEIRFETKFFHNIVLNAFEGFNLAQFIDGLRVIGHRAVTVHSNGDGPHAQKTKGHETKGKDGGGKSKLFRQ
jgi:hypothetical protein